MERDIVFPMHIVMSCLFSPERLKSLLSPPCRNVCGVFRQLFCAFFCQAVRIRAISLRVRAVSFCIRAVSLRIRAVFFRRAISLRIHAISFRVRTVFFRRQLPGSLFAGGQVAQDVFRPDIDGLVFVSSFRHTDAPVQIPGQRPVAQALVQVPLRERHRVAPPFRMPFHQPAQLPLHPRHRDIQVPGVLKGDGLPAQGAPGFQQMLRLQHRAAGIALVAPGSFFAFRAFSDDEPVCQEGSACLAVGLGHCFFIDIRAFIELCVELSHKAFVLLR